MASFRRSLFHVLNANLIVVLTNAFLVFGLPFVIGPADYGYWQLYQLYTLVLGYVTFGITDGLYVRFAGRVFQRMPQRRIANQFWIMFALLVAFSGIPISLLAVAGNGRSPQETVAFVALIATVFYVPRTLITIVLQAANAMRLYGRITVIERALVLLLTVSAVLMGNFDFQVLIVVDLVAKIVALAIAIALVPSIVLRRVELSRPTLLDTWQNLKIGMPILLANLSIIALPSFARLVIERQWTIDLFGAVSIGFSVSNTLLVLVNSVAISLFPRLRLVPPLMVPEFYGALKRLFELVLATALLFSFPATFFALQLLPDYAEGIIYLPILFAVFAMDSTMRILGANWLKSLREERPLLRINTVCTILGVVLMGLAGAYVGDIAGVLYALLVTVIVRAVWAEAAVTRKIGRVASRIEVISFPAVLMFFLALSWIGGSWGTAIYALCIAGYMLMTRKSIRADIVIAKACLSAS